MEGFKLDCGSWKTIPIDFPRIFCQFLEVSSRILIPLNTILFALMIDLSGCSPRSDNAVIDFPLPDSPTRETISCVPILNEISLRIVAFPIRRVRFFTSINGVSVGFCFIQKP